MTFPLINDLQQKYLSTERNGQGYSGYATSLNEAERQALTRVDAIAVGMRVRKHGGELTVTEEDTLKTELVNTKNSEDWFSAAKKLAKNPKVRQFVAQLK